jgi:hypothetical protein
MPFQNPKEIAYIEAYAQFRHHYNNVWRVQEFFTTAELAIVGAAAAIAQISRPVGKPLIEILLFVGAAISLGGYRTLVRARYYYLREIANLAILEHLIGLDSAENNDSRSLLQDGERKAIREKIEEMENQALTHKGRLRRWLLENVLLRIGKVGAFENPDYWAPNFSMQYTKGEYKEILYDPERWVRSHMMRRRTITFYFFTLQGSAMILFVVLFVYVWMSGVL